MRLPVLTASVAALALGFLPVHHDAPKTVTTPAYVSCPTTPQQCIDTRHFTLYHGNILAGHDWAGYAWVAQLPVGTTVKVPLGPVAGTYKVFQHMYLPRHGGAFPYFHGAALILQSCQGAGTAFSLLKRV